MKRYVCLLSLFILADVMPSVAADCADVGRKIADEQGGQLTKTTLVVQDNRNVCVVIVFIPGRNGEKPRRVEIAVPVK